MADNGERIVISFKPSGEVEVKTAGFKGAGCMKASAFIEEALGKTLSMKKTSEYYEEAQTEKVSLRNGDR
jgi:hypothetical protein